MKTIASSLTRSMIVKSQLSPRMGATTSGSPGRRRTQSEPLVAPNDGYACGPPGVAREPVARRKRRAVVGCNKAARLGSPRPGLTPRSWTHSRDSVIITIIGPRQLEAIGFHNPGEAPAADETRNSICPGDGARRASALPARRFIV